MAPSIVRHARSVSRGRSMVGRLAEHTLRWAPGVVGQVARAAPYVRGAFNAARAVHRAGGGLFRRPPSAGPMRKKLGKYHTRGTYHGKFKKRKIRKMKIDPYLKKGFKNTCEITGLVADPDCVYVGHSTTSGHQILMVILQSLLRKLFTKVGLTITNVTDPLLGYEGATDGWKLILTYQDSQNGATVSDTYVTIATTDTIYRIVGDKSNGVAPAWTALYDRFVQYINATANPSGFEGSTMRLVRLAIYRKDGNVGEFWQFAGDLYLANEIAHIYCKSDLKIQNRTLAATASTDAQDITNNPLQGKLYQFSSGAPQTRVEGLFKLDGLIDSTGALTIRAAEIALLAPYNTVNVMKEPPEPKIWNNIVKTGGIRLEPGAIKKDTLVFKRSMNLMKFLEKLSWKPNANAVGVAKQRKSIGKCSLIALEDMINVNALQNISIAYEINRETACYFTTTGSSIAQGMFSSLTQTNVPIAPV